VRGDADGEAADRRVAQLHGVENGARADRGC